jgi:calcium-dependent protein kinase
MMYIVSQLMSKKEKDELQNIFRGLDINGDGRLSREELIQGYQKMGHSLPQATAEADELLQAADADGSGAIDYTGEL